ncbi:MAG: type II toxin-antitoxin system VapC family toxin, partial [Acidimicrobiia bacterium]|nr:type II toxin-antitoxin system VapC family toxin [Acidimicrobiia bacterium]
DWLAQPSAVVVEPTARHLGIVQQLLVPPETGGNLVNDAHLAALAIEHRCAVVSYDRDFLRFGGVKLETPPAVDPT